MAFEVEVTNVTTGEKLTALIVETIPCTVCNGTGWDGGEDPLYANHDCDECLVCDGTGAELPEAN